ncbi:hypothetical protein LG293_17850 (plasmid) [Citricoccus nitrophenolicus]
MDRNLKFGTTHSNTSLQLMRTVRHESGARRIEGYAGSSLIVQAGLNFSWGPSPDRAMLRPASADDGVTPDFSDSSLDVRHPLAASHLDAMNRLLAGEPYVLPDLATAGLAGEQQWLEWIVSTDVDVDIAGAPVVAGHAGERFRPVSGMVSWESVYRVEPGRPAYATAGPTVHLFGPRRKASLHCPVSQAPEWFGGVIDGARRANQDMLTAIRGLDGLQIVGR